MAAGTRRGLLLLGTHSFVVQSLHVVFAALFMEYYVHGFLLIVDTRKGKTTSFTDIPEWRLRISKLGLCVLVAAQLVYMVGSILDGAGVVVFSSVVARMCRLTPRQRLASNEHRFALVFGLSWWVLRLPLVPSAVSFTLATAVFGVLSDRCTAFAQNLAREMTAQRPKEERLVQLASRAASGGAAVVALVAALLYDGSSPKRKPLRGFHWCLLLLCGAAVCAFSGLQRWRCSSYGEEAPSAAREECSLSSRSIFGFGDATMMEFQGFVRQTWQRRSMKALLVVRALHCYAHAAVVAFFHLLLTLGCAPRLSAAARAILLAFVLAAPSFLAPMHIASAGTVGKKRLVLVMLLGVCALGLVSLVAAFFTRGAVGVAVSPALAEDTTAASSDAGIWLCAILLTLLRLLLDSVRDVLELAQEDVVEEDAILFGRATPMASWTRRLCALVTAPMESLSRIATVFLLAFTNAFEGVVLAPPTITGNSTITQTASAVQSAAAALALERVSLSSAFPAAVATANVASTVLALLSLHTCGVALMMLVVWHRYYNLEGKHLLFVQMATRKRKDEQCVALV
ncbi:conserved hypothetical protein [Leishmania mexicana MHOM/GT/2001/U1103]|uniref:Uncharacterized protein n=1 Tax=Leishmania mexicana (strain MHOM/GT/2001/U1103) TaxID=929439 RepID=E9AM63_LEIMU|nr:conserved hypothetical protein [Leishmania mexicana MHOM/GT/2001/U1103]CBZ24018.1 conserved hypothetical protein [Leishmania mexicana MHOM/GT/2001/U1103]